MEYVDGLFAAFASIAAGEVQSTLIPPQFEVEGFRWRYRHHFIYWKPTRNGGVAIMTIRHERMQQALHRNEMAGSDA